MTTTIDLLDAAKRAAGCEFCGQRLCDEVAPLSPGVPEIELALLRRRVAVLELVLAAVAHEKGAHSGRLTRVRESFTSVS